MKSKGYWLLDPTTNKILVSSDVVFDETEKWDWESMPSSSNTAEISTSINGMDSSSISLPSTSTSTSTSITLGPLADVSCNQVESSLGPSNQERSPCHQSIGGIYSDSPVRKSKLIFDFYNTTDFVLFACEPQSFVEASKEQCWIEAMKEEMDTIHRNQTWELTDLPEGKKCIGLNWIYKTKFKEDGSISKHKARIVSKGYS